MDDRRDQHVAIKRSRGRPRSPQALTPAQRAKRYRDKKKREQMDRPGGVAASAPAIDNAAIKRDITKNVPSIGLLESRLILVNAENIRLSEDLEAARTQLQELRRALAESLCAHAAKKPLPTERVRSIAELLTPQEAKLFGLKSVTRHKK